MKIEFSRHARQRLKLYGLSRNDILEILAIDKADQQPLNVKRELISNDYVEKYGQPLLVAYIREIGGITVITNFPYDQETNYEDILR
ncbi:MAG TPA: hypothetical protein VFH95_16530 [Candidatus Kapabacteria bacterium]|nr:hypothetical protein [Candidatus Kapabacteria bacterium]